MCNLHYQMQIKHLQSSTTETNFEKLLQTTNLHPKIQEKKITMLITAPENPEIAIRSTYYKVTQKSDFQECNLRSESL